MTLVPLHELIRMSDRHHVHRWRHGLHGGWDERHIYLGWMADGRWFVERTGDNHGWTFSGDDQRAVRAAAEAKSAELRDGDGWTETVIHAGGVFPPTPATIVEWPPGLEPG